MPLVGVVSGEPVWPWRSLAGLEAQEPDDAHRVHQRHEAQRHLLKPVFGEMEQTSSCEYLVLTY